MVFSLWCNDYRCGLGVASGWSKLAHGSLKRELIWLCARRQLLDNDNTVPDYLNTHTDVQTPIDSPTQWPLPRELCEFACHPPQRLRTNTDDAQFQEEEVRRWYDIPFPFLHRENWS